MKRTPMTDKKLHETHVGDYKFSPDLKKLLPVEEEFIRQCTKRRMNFGYDITAGENHFFKTLAYTTYAKCFIMYPLCPEVALKQITDAKQNDSKQMDFFSFFKKNVLSNPNKYYFDHSITDKNYDAVVVLPGDNKIKGDVCLNKMKWIYQKHGDNVIYKPHPLTREKTIEEFKNIVGLKNYHIAHTESDLYDFIRNSSIVYTSHMSESALYSVILNKEINPIDKVNKRNQNSFTHINYYLFMDFEPEKNINKIFSDYRSGIIHPEIDENWKQKLSDYLDYILEVREKFKYYFI